MMPESKKSPALRRLTVINPNSSSQITAQIADTMRRSPVFGRFNVTVLGSPNGPISIESDADAEDCVMPMLAIAHDNPADGYVVACFSDPGLDQMRRELGVPVVGVGESAVLTGMTRARQVGILSTSTESIVRHSRKWTRLGISSRIAGELAVGRSVLDLESEEAYRDVLATAERLEAAGAEMLVLGCTGMSHMRDRLQGDLTVSVVDPCRAGLAAAAAAIDDERI